jgi:hypothetical protein
MQLTRPGDLKTLIKKQPSNFARVGTAIFYGYNSELQQ